MNRPTRQHLYRELFAAEISKVRSQFGSGVYSFTEGMNRKAARQIARNRARLQMRKLREVSA